MKPGSVIVDLAAEQGGNCELTEKNQVVVKHGVTPYRLYRSAQPSRQPVQSAIRHQFAAFADRLTPGKGWQLSTSIWKMKSFAAPPSSSEGNITWPPPPPKLSAAAPKPPLRPRAVQKARAKNRYAGVTICCHIVLGRPARFLAWAPWRRSRSCRILPCLCWPVRRLSGDLECFSLRCIPR